MGNLQILPKDVLIYTAKILSSKDRSAICSVSKKFESLAIAASKSLSVAPHIFDEDITRYIEISEHLSLLIITAGEYHLIVRLKQSELLELFYAAKSGCWDLLNMTIELVDEPNWDDVFGGACMAGHLDIARFATDKGLKDPSEGMYYACEHKYLKIVEMATSKNLNYDASYVFEGACTGGDLKIAKIIVEKLKEEEEEVGLCEEGDEDYMSDDFRVACKANFTDVIDYLMEIGVCNWDSGLGGACEGGHLSLMEKMIDKGARKCGRGIMCRKTMAEHLISPEEYKRKIRRRRAKLST